MGVSFALEATEQIEEDRRISETQTHISAENPLKYQRVDGKRQL